ncbi:MAG: hypothetical protein EZS28_027540 [Streblomastix strix]|uniref:Reverse transcriptase domain-containing protein n=1 Tax=Streblomastix strix TaxID=222440 RepID=A0A5J4V3F5_9EUKA|nr:MAG: hypothetical protein EZS28_027540 [Streblomastix strix]
MTHRIQEWNKINAGIDIQTGALPNWTSVEALQQLETIQKYREYHAPLPQIKIIDCRQVNAITNLIKFKMEGSEFIKQILEKLDFATTLDLENAFHHIKVSSDLLPYFGFAFQGRLFTQRWNIKISNYIDDIVLLHQDKDYLKRTTQEIIAFLQNLGFKIQLKKCRLYPSRVFNYLGWVWNSNSLEVMMTPQRRRLMKMEIKRWINATDNGEMVKVRDLAKLLGELNFLRFQIQDASLISNSLNHLKNKPRQLEDLTTQAILTTDAALEGWSSTLQIQLTEIMEAGRWQKNWHLKNSNQRKTAPVLMIIKQWNTISEDEELLQIRFIQLD